MDLSDYQREASLTVQRTPASDQPPFLLGYLGLAGETGSVLTTLKKLLRDGGGFDGFTARLQEELGDVLWYVAAIASHNNLSLEEIASQNLDKVRSRFSATTLRNLPRLDAQYPERFPDSFIVSFIEETHGQFLTVRMRWEQEDTAVELGDPLTDNSRQPNNYRYHDVFHLGHVAFLGWSPVLRHLMKLKRKSDALTLDAEDRGRAQVAEEAISLIVYNYARENMMLRDSNRLDTELLHTIKQLVQDLEVAVVSTYQWEKTIIESYRVFHQVVENRGGRVLVSPAERRLHYLGH